MAQIIYASVRDRHVLYPTISQMISRGIQDRCKVGTRYTLRIVFKIFDIFHSSESTKFMERGVLEYYRDTAAALRTFYLAADLEYLLQYKSLH